MIALLIALYLAGVAIFAVPLTRYLLNRVIATKNERGLATLYFALFVVSSMITCAFPLFTKLSLLTAVGFFFWFAAAFALFVKGTNAHAGDDKPDDTVSWARTNGVLLAFTWPLLAVGLPILGALCLLVRLVVALSRGLSAVVGATVVPLVVGVAGAYARALTGPRGRAEQARLEQAREEREQRLREAAEERRRRDTAAYQDMLKYRNDAYRYRGKNGARF